MQLTSRQLSPRWKLFALWAWVTLMAAPLGMLALWGVWVIDAERKSLWNEAKRKGELIAQAIAKLPMPRDAVPRLASLPSIGDTNFFYPELPAPQPSNEAQQLLASEQHERLLDGQFSGQLTSSGVPIGPLAAFALLRQATSSDDIILHAEQVMEMSVVRHPSILTASLLVEIKERLQREKIGVSVVSRWNELINRWYREEAIRRVLKQHETAILQQRQPTWYASGDKHYWVAIASVDPRDNRKEILVLDKVELKAAMFPRMERLLHDDGLSIRALYELYANETISVTWPRESITVPVSELVTFRANPDFNFGVRILVNEADVFAPMQALRWRVWLTILFSGGALGFGIWRTQVAFSRQKELATQKDNFLSCVSHELRAPLSSVRLMADGLVSNKLSDAERTNFQQFILLETQRLTSLVENLLDFARMEQGRRMYHFTDTQITHLLRDLTRSMELLAAKREICFEMEADEIDAHVDSLAIQQAIVNLLDNALKYSPDGGSILITLRTYQSQWELAIQDEGPGVPLAEREKIFERFYRVGSELRRTTTGVGIGLSIVEHIVKGHGGTVKVEGERGNCFRMTIPHRDNPLGEPSCGS